MTPRIYTPVSILDLMLALNKWPGSVTAEVVTSNGVPRGQECNSCSKRNVEGIAACIGASRHREVKVFVTADELNQTLPSDVSNYKCARCNRVLR